MPTRQEIQQRRRTLQDWLVQSCRDGSLAPGASLPPLRALAVQHGLSVGSAREVVTILAQEGLLHAQHGSGIYVGRGALSRDEIFLLLLPESGLRNPGAASIRNGFESVISRRGGSCLTLENAAARALRAKGSLPALSGVAEICFLDAPPAWSRWHRVVEVRDTWLEDGGNDVVYIDNEDGGARAASHLIEQGHRSIGFLRVHNPSAGTDLNWSRQRESGWRSTLETRGLPWRKLSFGPQSAVENSHEGLAGAGFEAAQSLLKTTSKGVSLQHDVSAIVTCNAHATAGMLAAFAQHGLPEELWPAIVAFDDHTAPDAHLLSVLRQDYEELGRRTALLLWERNREHVAAREPRFEAVPMELIPRLSCRRDATGLQMRSLHASRSVGGERVPD